MSDTTTNVVLSARKRLTVAVASMLLYLNIQCMTYAVNIIAPSILTALDGMHLYALVSVVNALGIMLSAPVAGKLGDQFGRKWITIGALVCHHLMFVMVASSQSITAFFAFYILAAIAGGLYIAAPFAILGDVIPMNKRSGYYGFLSAFGALGCMLGPVLSGILVDAGKYRIAYLLGIPLAVLTGLILFFLYPNKKKAIQGQQEKIDLPGLLLLVGTVAPVALYISCGRMFFGYVSAVGFGMLAFGAVCGICFFRRECRVDNPLVNLGIFKYRKYTIAWICRFLFTAYLTGSTTYIILYSQTVLKTSATLTSTFAMPQTILMVLASPFIGRFVGKCVANYRKMYLLMGICGFATLAMFSMLSEESSLLLVYAGMAIGGIAYAIEQTISTPYFQMEIPPEAYGAAQGLSFFASSAGGVLWGAVYASILSAGADQPRQILAIFRTGACIVLVVAAIALFAIRKEQNTSKVTPL